MYDMNTDPGTWPGPDDVAIIQAQERFEATDDFREAVIEWMTGDDATIDFASGRFWLSAAFDRAFDAWMRRGGQ